MSININFNRKIVINGKEYHSLDELPEDVRKAYDKALALAGKAGGISALRVKTKITFNGKEYEGEHEMSETERALYALAMKAAGEGGTAGTPAATAPALPQNARPVSPAIMSAAGRTEVGNPRWLRWLQFGGAVLLLIALAWYLLHSRGSR